MPMNISRESFDSADQPTKLLLIYDMLVEQNTLLADHTETQNLMCERRCNTCDRRFLALERRKIVDAGLAASGGVLGGILAIIAKIKFFEGP